MVKPTIAEVFSSYSVVNADLAETTLAHKKRALALFSAFLAEGGRPVTVWDVTRDDVAEWRAWLMHAKGPDGQARFKVSAINSYLKAAASLFNWCLQRAEKLVPENPFRGVRYLLEERPVLVYTADEIRALLEAADARWRAMILLGCTAGLARGECLNLTREDLDCGRNRVWIRPKRDDLEAGLWAWRPKRRGKERRPIELPMTPKMDGVLMEVYSGPLSVNQPYPFILPRRYWELRSRIGSLPQTVRNCPDSNFDTTWRLLCQQAGIKRDGRNFHNLRKTAITNWTRIPGLAPQDVMSLARHASLKTTMLYMAVNPIAAQIAEQHSLI